MIASDVDLMNESDTIIIASNEHQGMLTSVVNMNYFLDNKICAWKSIPNPRTLPDFDLTTESTDASFTSLVTIDVNDKSFKVSGGLQHIMTSDCAKNEFPYVSMCQIGLLPFASPKYLGVPPLFFSSGNTFSRQYNHACKNNTGFSLLQKFLSLKKTHIMDFQNFFVLKESPLVLTYKRSKLLIVKLM